MTSLTRVWFALVSLTAPAFADDVILSANGNTLAVSTSEGEPAPTPTEQPPPPPAQSVTVMTAPVARAQNTLAVDGLAVLPIGDYGRAVDVGVGAGIRLEVPVGRGFLTGRVGVVFHRLDVGDTLTLAPIYAGYRQPIGNGSAYLAGELGVTLAWATVETPYGRMSASDSELGALLSAGVRKGALDLRAGLFTPDLDDAFGLIATAGYDFAAF
jgi:hypothetical protein